MTCHTMTLLSSAVHSSRLRRRDRPDCAVYIFFDNRFASLLSDFRSDASSVKAALAVAKVPGTTRISVVDESEFLPALLPSISND